MSASATNARSTAMAPPVSTNILKRKTLAERAGEPVRHSAAPPSSRQVNSHVRATSIAGVPREASFSSSTSTSTRPSSSASSMRNISASSYSSSVGSGSRPLSGQTYRPHSAMSYSKVQKPGMALNRPTTTLESYEEEPGAARKRKGMTPFFLNPQVSPQSIRPPKIRKACASQASRTLSCESRPYNATSIREASLKRGISLSNAFGSLSLAGNLEHLRCRSPVQFAPETNVDVPRTPSHIPKLAPRITSPGEIQSPRKSPRKTPKALPKFLSKDSNTLTAWDTDSRLEEVEMMCSQFKEKWDGATTESKSLKEMMAVYKIRSTLTQTESFLSTTKLTWCSHGTRGYQDPACIK